MDLAKLQSQFHQEMVGLFDTAKSHYPKRMANGFRSMLNKSGGKATADKLLAMDNPSEGFTSLLLHGGKEALKLSVEYLVLQSPWRELFEPEQLATARRRLKEVECELPAEDLAFAESEEKKSKNQDSDSRQVVYFNNCKNRPHEQLFGRGAFYDLNLAGIQAKQAVGLRRGQKCVVATTSDDNSVIFTWYSFRLEKALCEIGTSNRTRFRVFFGLAHSNEKLTKEKARENPLYHPFFNVNGHFKQQSTITESVSAIDLPKGFQVEPPEIKDLRLKLQDLQQPQRPKTPETLRQIHRILKMYERPNAISRYVKRTRGSTCQLCKDPGFLMRNGQRYCEVHHLFHLSKNPPAECLSPEYLVVLCATCHRRMHYANVGDPVKVAGGWQVRVDEDNVLFQI